MALTSWPFDGQTVTETQFSQWANALHTSGVQGAGDFLCTGDSTGMQVSSAAGLAIVRGLAVTDDVAAYVALTAAAAQPRIDLIVLRLDPVANTITRAAVAGTPAASNPVPPTPTQTVSGIYEFPLAQVAVGANVATITSADVTDVRVLLSQIDAGAIASGTVPILRGGTGAADAATARANLGAGTSSLVLGTTAGTAKAGDYQPSAANISDSTAIGQALVKAASKDAGRQTVGVFVQSAQPAGVAGDLWFW